MNKRMTDERLADIEGFYLDGYDREILQALKAEREKVKELEAELSERECYGEWCGKGHDCLCPACKWKALQQGEGTT